METDVGVAVVLGPHSFDHSDIPVAGLEHGDATGKVDAVAGLTHTAWDGDIAAGHEDGMVQVGFALHE
jgi:hypothetical protein